MPAAGSISGTVFVAGSEKEPARRVRVTLSDLSRVAAGRTITTDDRGAFMFQAVPAGRFEIQAFKPGVFACQLRRFSARARGHSCRRQDR
jgi:hypothetical protein